MSNSNEPLMLRQYDVVRVVQLLRPAEAYDGWGLNQRPPQVGDVGTIVEILQAPGLPDDYVVECVGPGGRPIWLGDFFEEELAPLAGE